MTINRILRRAELLAIIGVSRSTLYAWIADGVFPKPVLLGKRAVGWPSAVVASWLDQRAEA